MNLYEITGNITDINTLLVPKLEFDNLRTALAKAEQERDLLTRIMKDRTLERDYAHDVIDSYKEQVDALTAERDELRAANKDLQAWYDAASADAKRYQAVRRGKKWSVIDGIGNELRAEKLDAAIDAAMKGQP